MKALFGVVGLLVVLAVVMMVGKKQLQALAPSAVPNAPSATPAGTGAAPAPTVVEQSRGVQQKVLQDVGRALEQGAARPADPQQ